MTFLDLLCSFILKFCLNPSIHWLCWVIWTMSFIQFSCISFIRCCSSFFHFLLISDSINWTVVCVTAIPWMFGVIQPLTCNYGVLGLSWELTYRRNLESEHHVQESLTIHYPIRAQWSLLSTVWFTLLRFKKYVITSKKSCNICIETKRWRISEGNLTVTR